MHYAVITNNIITANTITQLTFKSDHHNVFTVSQQKIGLSIGDCKRFDVDSINTRALGYYLNNQIKLSIISH